jgi:hypothetical protein
VIISTTLVGYSSIGHACLLAASRLHVLFSATPPPAHTPNAEDFISRPMAEWVSMMGPDQGHLQDDQSTEDETEKLLGTRANHLHSVVRLLGPSNEM